MDDKTIWSRIGPNEYMTLLWSLVTIGLLVGVAWLNGFLFGTGSATVADDETSASGEAAALPWAPPPDGAPDGTVWTNALGLEFVRVPSGSCYVGTEGDTGTGHVPESWYRVSFDEGFWFGRYEVTQDVWQTVMLENPAAFKGPRRPIEWVTPPTIAYFVDRLNGLDPTATYRLPYEDEWEYACRAGTTTAYSFGDKVTTADACFSPSYGVCEATVDVGSFPPNPWGFFDMHGNVAEWCRECPRDGAGAPMTQRRLMARGGGYSSGAYALRSAARTFERYARNYIGIRLVVEARRGE